MPPSQLTSPWRRVAVVVVGMSVFSATLTGCSALSDIVTDQAGQAACAVGSGALDQITTDVTSAISNISVDPAAALAALTTAEAALTVASVGITGEAGLAAVESAKATLSKLVAVAEDASNGAAVDQSTVTSLQDQFTTDLKALAGVC